MSKPVQLQAKFATSTFKGEYTGFTSKAMTAPDGKIRIPLNEESRQGGGQIEEYLMQFNGEGIQHIALICDDLVGTVDKLAMAGVPLMTAPNDVYYEMLEGRLPGHGQPVAELQSRGILLDGSTEGGQPRLLLQIFRRPSSARCFLSSSSAGAMRALAKATSRPCLSHWSATRCAVAHSKWHKFDSTRPEETP